MRVYAYNIQIQSTKHSDPNVRKYTFVNYYVVSPEKPLIRLFMAFHTILALITVRILFYGSTDSL